LGRWVITVSYAGIVSIPVLEKTFFHGPASTATVAYRQYWEAIVDFFSRRKVLVLAALGATATWARAAETEQAWPTKPVKIVVGFAGGGVFDVLGRSVAEKLAKYNGQAFVVDSRPGAGGNVGAGVVANAEPDGYQLMFTPGSVLTMNPSLYARVPFNAESFAPISLMADMPVLLVVNQKNPANTLGEFISAAKRDPEKPLFFSSPGVGTSLHLAIELFLRNAGLAIQHIPYKSGGEAVTAVLSGQVTGMFANPPFVMSQIEAGTLRVLAVAGSKRMPQLPDVPTTAEAGLSDFDISSWFGLVAPAKTSSAIVTTLSAQVATALREPDVRERLVKLGIRPIGSDPGDFAEFLRKDRAKWESVISASKIRLD
jgi:tripartite-type tricarboxylate transporter receptor subunit TctC